MYGRKKWLVLLFAALALKTALAQESAPASNTPSPPPPFRSLRENAPAGMPAPTEPRTFSGYPGAPPFSVVPRRDKLTYYPCTACHAAMTPNPEPRKLASPHPAALDHGNGRIWCLDCHQLKDRDHLHTLSGQPVDFDQAYLVCGQCHFNRQNDWYFGAHGKRVANWRGERVIYNCTFCHDPHSPGLKARAPSKPPPVRAGLQPMPPNPDSAAPATPYMQVQRAGEHP
jgi:hypothetical protein